jgi:FKBP-type peptidyl-prolyl cis-trans isomerase
MSLFDRLQNKAKETLDAEIAKGRAFLEENKKRPGVSETASGLQYEVITEGGGKKPTSSNSRVTTHYTGSTIDGNVFDSSVQRGQPLSFGLNQVIRGWTEGLQLMTVGSKYKFFIPYELGYGERGAGGSIPGGAALIFEVELLETN